MGSPTAYYDVEGGTTFATVTTEGGGVEGGGGGWTATTKAKEGGVGRGAAGAPPSPVSPPWRWSVCHLGTPVGDKVAGGDAGPLSHDDKGASAAR